MDDLFILFKVVETHPPVRSIFLPLFLLSLFLSLTLLQTHFLSKVLKTSLKLTHVFCVFSGPRFFRSRFFWGYFVVPTVLFQDIAELE